MLILQNIFALNFLFLEQKVLFYQNKIFFSNQLQVLNYFNMCLVEKENNNVGFKIGILLLIFFWLLFFCISRQSSAYYDVISKYYGVSSLQSKFNYVFNIFYPK